MRKTAIQKHKKAEAGTYCLAFGASRKEPHSQPSTTYHSKVKQTKATAVCRQTRLVCLMNERERSVQIKNVNAYKRARKRRTSKDGGERKEKKK